MSYYGIDPSTQPDKGDAFDRDDVKTWARKQARIAVDVAKHNFENELIGLHGNWDAGAIDFEALVDMFEDAAWDVVRRNEADE